MKLNLFRKAPGDLGLSLSKSLLVMKIAIFIIASTFAPIYATGYSQKVSLSETDASLSRVFSIIQYQSGYTFFYKRSLVKDIKVSVSTSGATVEEALDEVLKGAPLTYAIVEKTIVIQKKASTKMSNLPVLMQLDAPLVKITGVVQDESGEPLIGATVRVKGQSKAVASDINGQFSIDAEETSILVVSYTGFESLEVPVDRRTSITVKLRESISKLSEFVVTALGIEKERKALGYSVTEIKGEDLTQAREINVGNALIGKVAGLNVSSVAGGPGSAVNIQIRGMSSISQSNQPLYVINGVPMENETSSGRDQFMNAPDMGDNIGNVNPDDIESISVLKGAAASALYGSQAKAGVILITTKSGKAGTPASIEFNSNYVVTQVRDQTDFQFVYGQGSMAMVGGVPVKNKPLNRSQAMTAASWGPEIDGELYIQADGIMRPYSAAKNNISNFYRLGGTLTNTVAFTKGFDKTGSVRFSATSLDNSSMMPNAGLDRQSFNLAVKYDLLKGLKLDVRTNYIMEQAKNRPMLGDTPGSAAAGILNLANTVNINDFKDLNPDGTEKNLINSFETNPWFAANYFVNNTTRNRNMSSATLRYEVKGGLFIQGRAARDFYSDRYKRVVPIGTAYQPIGSMTERTSQFNNINADILMGKTFEISKGVTLTPNLGASYKNNKSETISAGGSGFSVPYVYYIGNVPTRTVSYGMSERETQAVYGTLEFNYKSFLYLTGSGRTDWFSTLATPGKNNPVDKFYPSISGSFLFTQFVPKLKWVDFGKLRVAYAEVGQATGPYQTQLSYTLNALSYGSYPLGQISATGVPNSSLNPSKATEFEVGTEMRLFNDRVSIDLAWYKKTSVDEIVFAPTSTTSGYSTATLNIGKLRNQGFEGLISITPVKRANGLTWTTSINGAINDNKIIRLAPGDAPLVWATARYGTAYVQHRVGETAGQMVAYDFERDAAGNIVLNPNTGLGVRSTVLTSMGSVNQKWISGWSNEFRYKRFNFSFLIDGKFGGKIYSNTDRASYTTGKNKATLVGRDQVWGKNQTAQQYYANLGTISSLFVKDASFIKFRQAILGYNFPSNMFNKTIKNLNVSLVTRELFTIMKKTNNIDPEAAYSGDSTGIEMGLMPPSRTFGLNLSTRF